MARKIKFGLEMSDGAKVRGSINEIREHFDMESIVGHFLSGKLVEWLEDRYYDEEVEKIKAINKDSSDLNQQLCDALGIEYNPTEKVNVTEVEEKNEKKAILRQKVTDENILAHEDRMAFNQDDLDRLVKDNAPEIYLCDSGLTVTVKNNGNPKYIGVGNARVSILCDEGVYIPQNMSDALMVKKLGISFQNIEFDANDGWGQHFIGSLYYIGEGVERNFSEAVKWFKKSAEQGNPAGEHGLAVCYDNGRGVEKNYDEATKWAKKSAAQNFIQGIVSLGGLYYEGNCVEKDYAKAIDLFKRGVKEGSSSAENWMGFCYYEGKCVEKNYEEALKWFFKAVQNGNDRGYVNVGSFYYLGYGVDQDYNDAVKYYRKAIELGNVEAIRELGTCYYDGNGVQQDYNEAVKLYKKAANYNDTLAKVWLGDCYYYGSGVKKNYDEAIRLYREAYDEGNIQGGFKLGCCYAKGHGVKKNGMKGEEIFEKISKKSLENNDLGILYDIEEFYESMDHGTHIKYLQLLAENGCEKSLEKLSWKLPSLASKIKARFAKEKAEKGNAEAQYNYAVDYCRDNKIEYLKWLTKSAEQGYIEAQRELGLHYQDIDEDKYIYWTEMAAKQDHKPALHSIYNFWEREGDYIRAEKFCKRLAEIDNGEYFAVISDLRFIRERIEDEKKRQKPQKYQSSSNEEEPDKKKGCFITTAVCTNFNKPDNCYELTLFRDFRDNWLSRSKEGKKMIREYYEIAPKVVRAIDAKSDAAKIYSDIWEKYLHPCLRFIEQKRFKACKEKYISMVRELAKKFLT